MANLIYKKIKKKLKNNLLWIFFNLRTLNSKWSVMYGQLIEYKCFYLIKPPNAETKMDFFSSNFSCLVQNLSSEDFLKADEQVVFLNL